MYGNPQSVEGRRIICTSSRRGGLCLNSNTACEVLNQLLCSNVGRDVVLVEVEDAG